MMTKFRHNKAAFTLIELLVVIAIIGILATLVTGAISSSKKKSIESRVKTQLQYLETQIGAYKAAVGSYPPDNPDNFAVNQLYYELNGVIVDNVARTFRLPGDPATFTEADVISVFGPDVNGFANVANSEAGLRFSITDLDPKMVADLPQPQFASPLKVLSVGVPWKVHTHEPGEYEPALVNEVNPLGADSLVNTWRYNSSNPTYNPTSYDLWAEVVIGSDVFIISNWED